MLKRAGNIFAAVSLFLLLLLNGTAHEFVHIFTGHDDTVDKVHVGHDGRTPYAAFEQEHHHCDFLDLQTPVFLTSVLHFQLFKVLAHTGFYEVRHLPIPCAEALHTALRGPPRC